MLKKITVAKKEYDVEASCAVGMYVMTELRKYPNPGDLTLEIGYDLTINALFRMLLGEFESVDDLKNKMTYEEFKEIDSRFGEIFLNQKPDEDSAGLTETEKKLEA
jgi:hypothetical protein